MSIRTYLKHYSIIKPEAVILKKSCLIVVRLQSTRFEKAMRFKKFR